MKIILTAEEAARKKEMRRKALEGCDKCPSCGNKIHSLYYIPTYKTFKKGFFNPKVFQVNEYKCSNCGCIWESDPFEI